MNHLERDPYGMYKTARPGAGPGPRLMGADTLIGDDVMNRSGENLGDIKEIMIDMQTGAGSLCRAVVRRGAGHRLQTVRGAMGSLAARYHQQMFYPRRSEGPAEKRTWLRSGCLAGHGGRELAAAAQCVLWHAALSRWDRRGTGNGRAADGACPMSDSKHTM